MIEEDEQKLCVGGIPKWIARSAKPAKFGGG
jgi:hypothetical protein